MIISGNGNMYFKRKISSNFRIGKPIKTNCKNIIVMCTNHQSVFGFYIEFLSMAYNMSYDISEVFYMILKYLITFQIT